MSDSLPRTLVTAIVNTAVAGAERGALDAAIALGIGHGGWSAEPELTPIYAAHAVHARDRGLAVKLNTQDSDATLIVTFAAEPGARAKHAAGEAKQQKKNCKHLVLPAGERTRIPSGVRDALLQWIAANHISVLHVIGSSETNEPGLQAATRDALVWVLEDDHAAGMLPFVERVQLGADGEIDESTRQVEVDGEQLYQGLRKGAR